MLRRPIIQDPWTVWKRIPKEGTQRLQEGQELWAREGVGHCILGRSMRDTAIISKRGLLDRGGQSKVLHHSKKTMHHDYAVTAASAEAFSPSW